MPVPVDTVGRVPLFAGLPAWAVEAVAAEGREVERPAGHVLLRQHDDVTAASFLLSGGVQFLLRVEGGEDLLVGASAESGGLVGWSMFRAPYRSTATVRCDRPCRLLVVPRGTFDAVFARDPRVHLEILRRVATVAADRLVRARQILLLAPGQAAAQGAGY